jgi:putative addiction module component (TIGR02574 family)
MNKADSLVAEAMSLPVEIRVQLIDRLIQSMNPTRKEIDELWVKEVEKRVEEIESGKVQTVPAAEVFRKIRKRLKK